MNIAPRPMIFKVKVPDIGWLTLSEGHTDIPSILNKVWIDAHKRNMEIEIVDPKLASTWKAEQ